MSFTGVRFIVVEDHDFQRWAVVEMLRDLGALHVASAAGGAKALDALAQQDPPVDVVITDLDMPDMDGMELIRRLAGTARPPALVLLSAQKPDVLRAVETMARAYGVRLLGAISKPVSRQKLRNALAAYDQAPVVAHARSDLEFTRDELDEALRRGEIVPYFQPKVEVRSGRVAGAEALARWLHPLHGVVGAGAIVPLAERTGLIHALTDAMLRQAFAALREWQLGGLRAAVCVNISAQVLPDLDLPDRIDSMLSTTGAEPAQVILEVTETAATTEIGRSLETLSRLRVRGFGLSIDDYGTGYASPAQLTRIPFTEIKVDQSFVQDALSDPASRAILESTLELAAKFDVAAVAEGVETFEHWDLLRRMGYTMVQGYYTGPPVALRGLMEHARTHDVAGF
jgi:EAL domain-containing protein (putative c-di-GMP-specific phosphodiesterase class I)/CheY-like chemotaxis protein